MALSDNLVEQFAELAKVEKVDEGKVINSTYKVINGRINYQNCHFKRIENFNWSCLTLGALGWGQIQIANANNLSFLENDSTKRKSWMLELCDKLFTFYDEEISKIGERKTWFSSIKSYWESK